MDLLQIKTTARARPSSVQTNVSRRLAHYHFRSKIAICMDQIGYREMIYPTHFRFQKPSEKQTTSVRCITQASSCAVLLIWSKNTVSYSSYLDHNFFHGRWEPDIRNMEHLKARFASNRNAQNPRARCNGTGKEPPHLSDHTWFDIDWPTRPDQIHLSKSRDFQIPNRKKTGEYLNAVR